MKKFLLTLCMVFSTNISNADEKLHYAKESTLKEISKDCASDFMNKVYLQVFPNSRVRKLKPVTIDGLTRTHAISFLKAEVFADTLYPDRNNGYYDPIEIFNNAIDKGSESAFINGNVLLNADRRLNEIFSIVADFPIQNAGYLQIGSYRKNIKLWPNGAVSAYFNPPGRGNTKETIASVFERKNGIPDYNTLLPYFGFLWSYATQLEIEKQVEIDDRTRLVHQPILHNQEYIRIAKSNIILNGKNVTLNMHEYFDCMSNKLNNSIKEIKLKN